MTIEKTEKLTFDLRFIQTITELAKKLDKQPHEIRRTSDFVRHREKHHVTRHELELNGTWTELKNKHFPKPRDLMVESATRQVKRYKNKLDRTVGDTEFLNREFLESLEGILNKVPLIHHKAHKSDTLLPRTKPIKRVLFAQLSDPHMGANVLAPEVAGRNEYNWTISARRHAYFARAIGDYKLQHRSETSLRLGLNGDIIAGLIHNQEWFVDLLVNQFAGALHTLVQFITYLSDKFGFIEIDCTSGNHGRNVAKGTAGRALVQKYDSYETVLYLSLKQIIEQSCTNVKINISMAPFAEFEIFGHSYIQTHGDTFFSMPNPGSKLDMNYLRSQMDRINSARENNKTLDVVLLGHYHTPTVQMTETGKFIIINGTLMGLDPFAQGIGINGNCPAQMMFEATEEHAVGDFRVEKLLGADKNDKLDEIIKPFKGGIE